MKSEAFVISNMMKVTKQAVSLMIQQGDYQAAAATVLERAGTDAGDGRSLLLEFGPELLSRDEVTVKMIEAAAGQSWDLQSDSPEAAVDYIRLFWGAPNSFRSFLQQAIGQRPTLLLVQAQLELNLGRASKMLADDDFPRGCVNMGLLLFELRKQKLFDEMIEILGGLKQVDEVVNLCVTEGLADQLRALVKDNPPDGVDEWYRILCHLLESSDEPLLQQSSFLEGVVERLQKSMPLVSVIERLCKNEKVSFEAVRKPLNQELSELIRELKDAEDEHGRLAAEVAEVQAEIDRLENDDIDVKPLKCDKCDDPLELPYIGFFCRHRVHEQCATIDENGMRICPKCGPATERTYSGPRDKHFGERPIEPDILDSVVRLIDDGYFL